MLTSWGSRGLFPTVTLKVARMGIGSAFTMLATDGPKTYSSPVFSALESYPVRIPVREGDVIGARIPVANYYCRHSQTGDLVGVTSADVQPGQVASFESTRAERLPIEAQIERDADGDGYGDETQDLCSSDASTQGACPVLDTLAPDTSITKGPKKKVRSKKATFQFSSTEPGSTFECSLDGADFAACSSPAKIRVRKTGKHNFLVRARDAAGNADPSEARWSWKRVKKKAKKKN